MNRFARATIFRASLSASALLLISNRVFADYITYDTFVDSGSPGTPNPANKNTPISDGNGNDIYSYGADGKVKATVSNYSSSYPYQSATHVMFKLPDTFWASIANVTTLSNVTVSYYPYNDSLSTTDGLGHDNLELHPMTAASSTTGGSFTTGNGQQSTASSTNPTPSTMGGATWTTVDGPYAHAWDTPGGNIDNNPGDFVLANVTDATLPVTKPTGSPSAPFQWTLTSLINNPTTRAEIQTYGLLIKVTNESNNPAYTGTNAANDFVSFYSADETVAGTNTAGHDPSGAYLPTVTYVVPEPVAMFALLPGVLLLRRRRCYAPADGG